MTGTIVNPLLGGVLIGVSSSLMLLALGRITGISGFLSSTLSFGDREDLWKYSFLIGLICGGIALSYSSPHFFNYTFEFSALHYIVAGFLVGFGTRLGSGCTSGHGVCGVARLSKRSIVATITFILFGIITVAVKGRFL